MPTCKPVCAPHDIAKGIANMTTTLKERPTTVDDAVAQIVRLREEVDTLMRERVTPAVSAAVDALSTQSDRLTGKVRGRPLTSIAIAGAVGYLVGRLGR
jgi:ElaB/YqjD/DUF883 family membrane-anchored ribosome-binding protein